MSKYYRELFLLLVIALAGQVFGETRKIVAVVDTGLPYNRSILPYLCKGLQYDITNKGIQDANGHGTNIIGLIAKNLNTKTHCISMIKWWHSADENVPSDLLNARIADYYKLLLQLKPTLVNLSLSGKGFIALEYNGIKALLSQGTKVVVSAGNDKQNLSIRCLSYPACYPIKHKHFYVVGATDSDFANYGGPITDILPGRAQRGIFGITLTGTSQSCANKSAELLREVHK